MKVDQILAIINELKGYCTLQSLVCPNQEDVIKITHALARGEAYDWLTSLAPIGGWRFITLDARRGTFDVRIRRIKQEDPAQDQVDTVMLQRCMRMVIANPNWQQA